MLTEFIAELDATVCDNTYVYAQPGDIYIRYRINVRFFFSFGNILIVTRNMYKK